MSDLPRCLKCGYAYVRGVCPICEGRRVNERIPMMAPMPEVARPKTPTKQLRHISAVFQRMRGAE